MIGDAGAAALRHVASSADGGPLPDDARIVVHFHPDRGVLGRLVADGVYRSQFETLTSNGGLTAFPGGDRWEWEHRTFGGAYDAALLSERPKYGALDLAHRPEGAALRFGSAHLRLKPAVLARASFCYPDSAFGPIAFGTAKALSLQAFSALEREPFDRYVEAHIHGPLRMAEDVEAVVLDPCHRGTATEATASHLPCAVEWHGGFRLHVSELRQHPRLRGPDVVVVGEQIAVDGWLDAAVIGEVAGAGNVDPQLIKQLWHCVAMLGR